MTIDQPPIPVGDPIAEPITHHPVEAPNPNPPKTTVGSPYNLSLPHTKEGTTEEPNANFSTFNEGGDISKMTFSHSAVGTLTTDYGINYATWNYVLNTQHYETYAGEVIQILSTAVNDVTIRGQIATYEQMEHMFKFFARYMERVTQGSAGIAYSEEPMRVIYPTRGWDFYIQPKEMLGFSYGREVVAPEWTITAAVYDISPSLENDLTAVLSTYFLQVTDADGSPNPNATALDDSFDLTGQIGFNPNNPFSNPFPDEGITGKTDPSLEKSAFADFGKYYNQIVNNFANNKYNTLLDAFGSGPSTKNISTPTTSSQKAKAGGKTLQTGAGIIDPLAKK